MCGIAGLVSTRGGISIEAVVRMRDALRHRGPDDAGEWVAGDGRVGFGHRRLSIIDLSPAGHQPMHDAAGELCIVFNGEIYNYLDLRAALAGRGHRFRSQSDTEVLLAAYHEWGTDCLAHLNGMFAFALHDARERRVFLARDRAGEKPLFYRLGGGELAFASELKALLADPASPRRIDREALDCYLAWGFIAGERCILEGVRKLPPAHAMTFELDGGASRVWRYWRLPETRPVHDEAGLVDELDALLADAVRRQLLADVPVGVLLSGGVDSSLVTAMAVRASPKVRTFTVRFSGHDRFDESAHARLVARHLSTEHTELEAADATVDLLPVLARQFDEPIADSSMIPTYLVSRLIREHCTVALGGDGGDELFGGYAQYNRLLSTKRRVGRIPRVLRAAVAGAAGTILPLGFRGRVTLQGLDTDWRGGLPMIAPFFDPAARHALLAGHEPWVEVAERIHAERIPEAADLLERATRMDFENYMPEDILVKVDRASMLTSLEVRAPLLDHRVIELAFGKVPTELKATVNGRKLLLKKLAARLMPPGFDLHRKQGFGVPLAAWLRSGPWRTFFREVLLERDGILSRRATGDLLDGQDRGRANSERLFGLVMLELWRREYGATL